MEQNSINPSGINPVSSGDQKDILDTLPSNDDLVTKINNWKADSKNFHEELLKKQKKSGRR